MTILLLGDSHSDPFIRMPNVDRFDLSKCNPWLFTSNRFTNPGDTDLWNKLDAWFTSHTINNSNPSKTLVITSGEIDIRAHYWRHIPRHYLEASDIVQFLRSHAVTFYNTLISVCEKYRLDHVVVWSPPVAGERAQYNSEHPFAGSSQTRNKLIHMWNREFSDVILSTGRFSLATAYYNFINPVDYSTVSPSPSHDGVHWHDSYGPSFWDNIIVPAMSRPGLFLGENWNLMYNDKFGMTEELSQGTQKYDTWARSDQFQDITGIDHHVHINGHTYSWITASQRSRLPEQYIELSLKKL